MPLTSGLRSVMSSITTALLLLGLAAACKCIGRLMAMQWCATVLNIALPEDGEVADLTATMSSTSSSVLLSSDSSSLSSSESASMRISKAACSLKTIKCHTVCQECWCSTCRGKTPTKIGWSPATFAHELQKSLLVSIIKLVKILKARRDLYKPKGYYRSTRSACRVRLPDLTSLALRGKKSHILRWGQYEDAHLFKAERRTNCFVVVVVVLVLVFFFNVNNVPGQVD